MFTLVLLFLFRLVQASENVAYEITKVDIKSTFESKSNNEDLFPIPPPFDDGDELIYREIQPMFIEDFYISVLIAKTESQYSLCLDSIEKFNYCKDHPDDTEKECYPDEMRIDIICLNNTLDLDNKLANIKTGYRLDIVTALDIPLVNLNIIKEKINVSISKYPDSDEDVQIGLSGNIQNQVSNLLIQNLNINITQLPLIVENLILQNSNITSISQNIQSKNFIIDRSSYDNMNHNFENINSEYFSFNCPDLSQKHMVVLFDKDKWNVYYRSHNSNDFELYYSIPYSMTEKLNLIVCLHFFEFYVANNETTELNDVNISLLVPNYKSKNITWREPIGKYLVKFSNYGEFDGVSNKLSVYFSSYEKYVETENNCDNNKIDLIKVPFYDPRSEIPPDVPPEVPPEDKYPEDHPHQPETKPNPRPYIEMYVLQSNAECSYYKQFLQKCKENPQDEECDEFDPEESPSDIICVSNANNINNELANINTNDDLTIITEKDLPNIDFNQLKTKRSITFKSSEADSSKLLTHSMKLIKNLKEKRKNIKERRNKENNLVITIGIQGNINEKVLNMAFITDQYSPLMSLKVLSSPLNIESLEIGNCMIHDDSEAIQTKRMMITGESFYSIEPIMSQKVQVKQFSLYIPYKGRLMYRIAFDNIKWSVFVKFFNSENDYMLNYFIPYSICSRFNLITVSHFFDLNLPNSAITTVKPINITLLSRTIYDDSPYTLEESESKYLVKLTSSGEWDKFGKDVSVYFTSYQDYVTLDEKCNSNIKVSKFNFIEDGSIVPPAPDDEDPPIINPDIGPFQPPFSKFTYSAQLIVSNDKGICDGMKKTFDYCKKNPDEENCYLFENLNYYGCTSPQNINNELPNIPQDGDSLSILTFTNINEIDFNKLNHKMTVQISYQNDDDDLKLLSNIKKTQKKSKLNIKDSSCLIGIKGNIKDKVSFLTLERLSFQILESPLNIENLYLKVSTIHANSQKIQVTNLIADGVSHGTILTNSADKIDVKQYALKSFEEYKSEYKYRIVFGNDNWTIETSNIMFDYYIPFFPEIDFNENPDINPSDFLDDFPINVPSYIPYNFCERFTFIMPSQYYELHAIGNVAKPVNITVMDLDSILLENAQFPVSLSTTGEWDEITKPVSVYITTFKNLVDVNTNGCNSKVEVKKYDAYNPIVIIDSSSKDDKFIGDIDVSNKNQEEIEEEINKKYDINDKSDQYVTIKGDVTNFSNLDLSSNQFIKLEDNAKVTLSGGNLNLLIDDSSSVNINVSNNNDVKLSIKNKAECTVNIETDSKEISINSNSEIYNTLKLTVPETVEKIKIDSINLHDSGSISAIKANNPNTAVTVEVTNLQAQAQTSGKLTKVEIVNEFSISETASLELDDVILKNAKFNLNLHSYSYPNYMFPMLHGKLGHPPSEVKINKPTNGKTEPSNQEKNKEFLIFQGTFSPNCLEWQNALNLSEIYFNTVECKPISGTLDDSGSLVLKFVGDNKPKDDGKNNNKLTSAQIAGIVVGVVAAVAIIVIVVVVVIIRKKKKQQKSSAESGNEQNDL